MTRRVLISVGCNNYTYCNPLYGADPDARRVFETLIQPRIGDYDFASSHLLLSPTLNELQSAIVDSMFRREPIDTLTLFFAGHGKVKSGSFYMCVKDSRDDALSGTALSL